MDATTIGMINALAQKLGIATDKVYESYLALAQVYWMKYVASGVLELTMLVIMVWIFVWCHKYKVTVGSILKKEYKNYDYGNWSDFETSLFIDGFGQFFILGGIGLGILINGSFLIGKISYIALSFVNPDALAIQLIIEAVKTI